MDRRTELAEGALAYVLAHGLIDLSLRPLAAALGTSDRMLIYYFGSKDELVTEVVRLANTRIAAAIEDAPIDTVDSVGALVRHAWRALRTPDGGAAMRLYLELCVLSGRDPQRWSAAQQLLRGPWLQTLRAALAELETAADEVETLADLVLDGIDGLLLHRIISVDPGPSDAAAEALARLLDRST